MTTSNLSVDTNEVINSVKNTVKLKKSSARRKLEELNRVLQNNPYFGPNMDPQNNKTMMMMMMQRRQLEPFTPFNGDRDLKQRYVVAKDQYEDPFIQDLEKRKEYTASGFRVDYTYDRLLNEAFRGLGCIISEELA